MASPDSVHYLFGYRPTLSGVEVSDSTALEAIDYFAGIRNISEDLATLPLITYRRIDERRRQRDPDHHLYPMLHDQPNEEMDAVQFVEMMQAWAMMRRNAYAEIVRGGDGRAMALWPIPPYRVWMRRVEGELYYTVNLPQGEKDADTGLPWSVLDRSRMFHLKAFALDGCLGTSSITTHQESLGLALALERYGAAFFGNDATPGGVYQVPGRMSDEAYARLKAEKEAGRGLSNKHRVALLEEGTTFKETAVPNDKAQFIESRRLSTEVMARLNRIAPHKIGDLSRATFSNIEHQGIDYVVSSIRPNAVRWEKAISMQVMTKAERQTHYAEFLLDALLRGDSKSRAETLAVERQNGVINADEWRVLNNMNPIEDGSGQAYLVNGTMIPVGQAGLKADPAANAPNAERLFRPLFVAAAEQCLRKESIVLTKQLDRSFKSEGLRGFEAWAMRFYTNGHKDMIRRAWMPLAVAVGEAVRGDQGPDMGEWAESYVATIAEARQRAALEQLRSVLASGSSNVEGVLRTTLDTWHKEEPAVRMADHETRVAVKSAKKYLAGKDHQAA